jgi:hypothetical protein
MNPFSTQCVQALICAVIYYVELQHIHKEWCRLGLG